MKRLQPLTEGFKLSLFAAFGIELEYMVVSRNSLNVLPIVDKLLCTLADPKTIKKAFEQKHLEVERGPITYSNELSLHVMELKTTRPELTLQGVDKAFQKHVRELNQVLESFDAQLMPTGMHPWIDPSREFHLWPSQSFEAYHRIFNCQRHGWVNIQGSHINLPFASDDEFLKLHAVIRYLLPILPALAASSPILEGQSTGLLDNRLEHYRYNTSRVPSITDKVIPEVILSKEDYNEKILKKMYRDIAPLDEEETLQHEWLNNRGAIARFDRHTIEIRVLDMQECCLADLAIAQAVIAVVKGLVMEKSCYIEQLDSISTDRLHRIFLNSIGAAEKSQITDREYLRLLGVESTAPIVGQDLWKILCERFLDKSQCDPDVVEALEFILEKGSLATRIMRALQRDSFPLDLKSIYNVLCNCLQKGELF